MFVLVRHGFAGDKRTWTWPDDERPLTELGRRQAEGLVASLADVPVTRILSSPVVRCRQTVTPLAEARGLAVESNPLLEPDGEPERLERLVARLGDGAVLSTHGEFLDRLLGRWVEAGLRLEGHDAAGTAKGAAWVVEDLGTQRARARYVPARPGEP
jgi:phosphohistidine phosphatase SixA